MYVLGNTIRQSARYSDKSVGNSHPSITSTTGTCFLSRSIDATLGSLSSEPTTTTRCSEADLVFLRLEANCANSSIKSSVIMQFRNASVFGMGEDLGLGNRVERARDTSVLSLMTSTSREGKDGREMDGMWCSRYNSRMLSRMKGGNPLKGLS